MRMSVCVRSVIRFIMLYLFIANPSITLAQFIGDFYIVIDPGHVMRVSDHAQAQGAIIGKAMSTLESGRGLVLVLVALQ